MATLSEIEGAISGMRQLAQDRSLDTVLISCKGHETRFRLPVPRKGKNGKGAKVLYEGEWVAPTKFEEACGVRSKVWRRSFKLSQHKQPKRTCHLVTKARVYTGLPEDPNGWVRMDVWLSRQSQQEEVEGSVGPQKGKRSSSSAGGASSPSDEEASHSSSEGEGKSSSSGNKASNDSDEEDSHSLSAHPSADPEEQGQQNAGFGPSIFEPAEAYKPIDPHSAGLAKFGPAGVADKQPKPANSTPPKHSARNTAFLAPFCARPASVAKTGPAKAGEGATYTPQDQPEDGPRMQETSGPSGEEVKGANNGIGFQLLKKRGRPSKKSLREDGLRMQEAPGPSAGGKEGVKNGIVFPQQKKRGRPSKKIQSEDGPRMQEALDSSAGKKEGAKTGIGFQQQIKGGRPPKKSQPDNAPGLRVASGPSPRDKEGSDEGVTVQQEKKRGRPPKVAQQNSLLGSTSFGGFQCSEQNSWSQFHDQHLRETGLMSPARSLRQLQSIQIYHHTYLEALAESIQENWQHQELGQVQQGLQESLRQPPNLHG